MCRLSAGAQREGHNPTLQRHIQARPPLEPARNVWDIWTAKDRRTTTRQTKRWPVARWSDWGRSESGYISLGCALRGGAEPWQGLVKILPHMSNELAIRGMIGCLNTDDNWIQRGHVLLYVS